MKRTLQITIFIATLVTVYIVYCYATTTVVSIDSVPFRMDCNLADSFYKKYNTWSYESSERPTYFGCEVNEIGYSFEVKNNQIMQITLLYARSIKQPKIEILQVHVLGRRTLVECDDFVNSNSLSFVVDNILINKREIGDKVQLTITDLDNIKHKHNVFERW